MTNLFIILYLLVCFFWGLFSIEQQKRFHPQASGSFKLIIIFLINLILCPVAMLVAYIILTSNTSWARKIKIED